MNFKKIKASLMSVVLGSSCLLVTGGVAVQRADALNIEQIKELYKTGIFTGFNSNIQTKIRNLVDLFLPRINTETGEENYKTILSQLEARTEQCLSALMNAVMAAPRALQTKSDAEQLELDVKQTFARYEKSAFLKPALLVLYVLNSTLDSDQALEAFATLNASLTTLGKDGYQELVRLIKSMPTEK